MNYKFKKLIRNCPPEADPPLAEKLETCPSGRRVGNSPKGFIALISVIIVGAAAVSVAVSLLLLGVGAVKTSLALEQSSQAKGLANACAEQALEIIRENLSYSGTGGLALDQGTCSYAVIDRGGQNKTINAAGTAGTVIRKVKINVSQITPAVNVASWQEVADF